MDKKEFEQAYGVLSNKLDEVRQQERDIRNEIENAKNKYISTFHFKVDDCVRINHRVPLSKTTQTDMQIIEKGWIKEIKVMVFGDTSEIILIVDKPKKDGTRSIRGAERAYSVKLDEVEVINEND